MGAALQPEFVRAFSDESARQPAEERRQVLEGRFRTDGNNELSYHVKAPLSGGEKIPHQIRLKGAWSLTDDHTLRLTLDKSGRETFGDQLTLEGERGRQYLIQAAPSLGAWTDWVSLNATDATVSFFPPPSDPARFFRAACGP